jgi:hypothetical protein
MPDRGDSVQNRKETPEPPDDGAAATRHALRKSVATVVVILVCLVIGAWILLGLAFAWLFASAGGAVGAFVALVLAAIPPLALFLAWMRWGPWWSALRRIHWICRRTFGAA